MADRVCTSTGGHHRGCGHPRRRGAALVDAWFPGSEIAASAWRSGAIGIAFMWGTRPIASICGGRSSPDWGR